MEHQTINQPSQITLDMFSPEKQKIVYEICSRALLRAMNNGTFDQSKFNENAAENLPKDPAI